MTDTWHRALTNNNQCICPFKKSEKATRPPFSLYLKSKKIEDSLHVADKHDKNDNVFLVRKGFEMVLAI